MISFKEASACDAVWRRGTIQPLYIPRADMRERVRFWFKFGMDTALIARITGYRERSVLNWLHSRSRSGKKL